MTTNKDVCLAARLIPKACDYRRDKIKTPNLLSGFSHLPLVPTQPGLRPIACRSAFCLKYRRDYYCLGGADAGEQVDLCVHGLDLENTTGPIVGENQQVFLDHHLARLLATRLQLFPAILKRSVKTAAFKIAYL